MSTEYRPISNVNYTTQPPLVGATPMSKAFDIITSHSKDLNENVLHYDDVKRISTHNAYNGTTPSIALGTQTNIASFNSGTSNVLTTTGRHLFGNTNYTIENIIGVDINKNADYNNTMVSALNIYNLYGEGYYDLEIDYYIVNGLNSSGFTEILKHFRVDVTPTPTYDFTPIMNKSSWFAFGSNEFYSSTYNYQVGQRNVIYNNLGFIDISMNGKFFLT